ncbi:MAG: lysophospholipid acyltransferase family protein [Candidatus Anammoxibacter sp.]
MYIPDKIKQKIVKYLGAVFAIILLNTLKTDKKQINLVRNLSKNGKNVIYAFWHCNMLIPGYLLKNLGIQVLVSQHRDGEYIAGVISLLGFGTVRGSTTRGGARAMIHLTKKALKGHSIIITPDGPQGPRHIAQPGIIFLAKKTGFPIIPIAVKVSKYWKLPSWDRFIVPKPFAKVTLSLGRPIHVSRKINDEQVKQYCRVIEEELKM